jgi:hypothetical protein
MGMKCDRCNIDTIGHTMSMFNTDQCCFGCIDIEKKHPQYKNAVTIELAAVKQGNMTFQGIGLPKGYREWANDQKNA